MKYRDRGNMPKVTLGAFLKDAARYFTHSVGQNLTTKRCLTSRDVGKCSILQAAMCQLLILVLQRKGVWELSLNQLLCHLGTAY